MSHPLNVVGGNGSGAPRARRASLVAPQHLV
jgi:hypothetical protein